MFTTTASRAGRFRVTAQREYEAFGALPLKAGFTAVNQVSSSVTDGTLALLVTLSGVGGGNNIEGYYQTAPSTPYDVYMKYVPFVAAANSQTGMLLRHSSTGRLVTFGQGSTLALSGQNWTSATVFSASIWTAAAWGYAPTWLRIHNDGTTLTFYVSQDGVDWYAYQTQTLAAFIAVADQLGFYICPGTSGAQGAAWIQSFGTGTPT